MITQVNNNLYNNHSYPSFGAIKVASYTTLNNKTEFDILQLEKTDCGYLRKLTANIQDFWKKHKIENDEERIEMTKVSFKVAQTLLNGVDEDKLRVYMAFDKNKNPLGIIMGNALKKNKKGEIKYSTRKNHDNKTTELDCFVTWSNKEFKGIGVALLNEFHIAVKNLGFRKIYVRSEIPSLSSAHRIYHKNAYRDIGRGKAENIVRNGDNSYIHAYCEWAQNTKIIPMLAKSKSIKASIKNVSDLMHRNGSDNHNSFSISEYQI